MGTQAVRLFGDGIAATTNADVRFELSLAVRHGL